MMLSRIARLGAVVCVLCYGHMAAAITSKEPTGIELQSTRVIYPGDAKNGMTFTVTNRSSQVYLLQSRIQPWRNAVLASQDSHDPKLVNDINVHPSAMKEDKETTLSPFIILPPLVRFSPNDAIVLRIRLVKNTLPKDRESVFTLMLKAIPSQALPKNLADKAGLSMALALQNNLKLFYRPAGMPLMTSTERAEKLQFTRQNSELVVTNPTPYYVTLSDIQINRVPVPLHSQRMLAPFSKAQFTLARHSGDVVSWQTIGDDGMNTPAQTQKLHHVQ
ncbi:fimbria/pilus periplasmic chaperone [Providencia sneebia]